MTPQQWTDPLYKKTISLPPGPNGVCYRVGSTVHTYRLIYIVSNSIRASPFNQYSLKLSCRLSDMYI